MNEWNLEIIYKTHEEFEAQVNEAVKLADEIALMKGTLNNKENLKKYVILSERFEELLERAFVYSSMKKDLNQKNPENTSDFMFVYGKYNEISSKLAFAEPEILEIGEDTLKKWIEEDEKLSEYKFTYSKLFRMNKFIFDAKTEELLSNDSAAMGGFYRLYDNLAIVDNTTKKVTISDGTVLDINESNFIYYLEQLKNPADRKLVFEAVYKHYSDHKATFACIYDGIMASELANMKNRGYESILDSRLYGNNIDKNVFLSLVNTAKNNTKPLKEYLAIRKKFFNLEQYHTYDRFLKFTESKNKYSYENSREMVLDALKTMGDDFYSKAQSVLAEGRVSVYAQDGKRTGAYSTSTYVDGPFILLNHTETLNDAFTIAHEAGHSIHTMYANEAQPQATASYQIFVAEVASTFNEQVFLDYMIKNTKDSNEKLVLLESAIDGLIGTFYRQVVFADYEYQAHTLKESGGAITPDALSDIMKKLYLEYYGIDLNDEPYKEFVWGYIPHLFHTPFYVYQYATSYSASLALYTKVKNNEDKAFDKYINLLKSGGSNYPVELLKEAGCDLTTDEPFMAVVDRLSYLVEELKKTLGYED